MPRDKKKAGRLADKHSPLDMQIDEDTGKMMVRTKEKTVKPGAKAKAVRAAMEDDPTAVPRDIGERILKEARMQRVEIEAEEAAHGGGAGVAFVDSESEDEGSVYSADEETEDIRFNPDGYVEAKMNPEDEALLARFMAPQTEPRRTLGDLIMEQIQLAEARKAPAAEEGKPTSTISPRIVAVYTQVGAFLKRYKSGKLPKVFKMLPGLQNWEELLYITQPDSWSPHAVFAATRIFASNLNALMAQRFYAIVLLPAVRDDIDENKRLNYHLYMALKKACYKPAAFFKGIIIPLCDEGDCTLREATIISSVIKKVSLPQLHSAATMVKIASMRYGAATSIFLRTLFDKKYALPYRVLDAIVDHFSGFASVPGAMPVIWHQSLLSFVQRYKAHITDAQKASLRALLKVHSHREIAAAIRTELFGASRPVKASMAE